MGNSISSAFRAALAQAVSALPQPSKTGVLISAAELQALMGPESAALYRAIVDDLLAVIAEIQRYRDTNPGADQFFRQRGIVTRIRSVR